MSKSVEQLIERLVDIIKQKTQDIVFFYVSIQRTQKEIVVFCVLLYNIIIKV